MKKVCFTKMVASGNDFILLDQRQHNYIEKLKPFAVKICDRKYGIGADGLLVIEKSKFANIRMRIFNPDGSEPNMCGNGIRCVAFYINNLSGRMTSSRPRGPKKIETRAGIIEAEVKKNLEVKVKMSRPKNIKLDLPIKINKRKIRVNFINTGVPHAVIFVEGLDKINVVNIGRQIRFHKRFMPEGTNVNFAQIIDDNNMALRTYERGVEDETLACGTGTVAAALINNCIDINPVRNLNIKDERKGISNGVNLHTKSGEILKVEFDKINGKFKDIWLRGKARIIYSGVYYV